MAKKPLIPVLIEHIQGKYDIETSSFIEPTLFSVHSVDGAKIGEWSYGELMKLAHKNKWHMIPAALVRAVNEFAVGGWKLTRPEHCR